MVIWPEQHHGGFLRLTASNQALCDQLEQQLSHAEQSRVLQEARLQEALSAIEVAQEEQGESNTSLNASSHAHESQDGEKQGPDASTPPQQPGRTGLPGEGAAEVGDRLVEAGDGPVHKQPP